jgi:anti-anti-sigma factor
MDVSIVASRDAFGLLALRGDLDMASAAELSRALADDTVEIVDMSEVEFLGAAGLRVLVAAQRARRARGRCLCVVRPSRAVRRTLEIVGLLEIFVGTADDT